MLTRKINELCILLLSQQPMGVTERSTQRQLSSLKTESTRSHWESLPVYSKLKRIANRQLQRQLSAIGVVPSDEKDTGDGNWWLDAGVRGGADRCKGFLVLLGDENEQLCSASRQSSWSSWTRSLICSFSASVAAAEAVETQGQVSGTRGVDIYICHTNYV